MRRLASGVRDRGDVSVAIAGDRGRLAAGGDDRSRVAVAVAIDGGRPAVAIDDGREPSVCVAKLEEVDAGQGVDGAEVAADRVEELVKGLGLSKKLSDYGIRREDLPSIARDASGPEEYSMALQVLEAIF